MAEYYLPEGTWTDFLTGKVYEGGKWYTEKHGYLSVPLLVKENAIVPVGACEDKPDYDYADHAELRIYALQDGCRVSKCVYGMNNQPQLTITATRNGGKILIETNDFGTGKPYSIRLVNLAAAAVSGAEMMIEGNDTVLKSASSEVEVTIA